MNTTTTRKPLLILSCSGMKLDRPAPALDRYQGVMYQTFRAHVREQVRPQIMILSALHGFVSADAHLAPYNQRMTPQRSADMVANLDDFEGVGWPENASGVLLAGGGDYRRIMQATLDRLRESGRLAIAGSVAETCGGIGEQRAQLATWLRQADMAGDIVGFQRNGTALYRTFGQFHVNEVVRLAYRGRPQESLEARIDELFQGPSGPTASVTIVNTGNPDTRWVGLDHLHPIRPTHTRKVTP
jgi:hypothetical protein